MRETMNLGRFGVRRKEIDNEKDNIKLKAR